MTFSEIDRHASSSAIRASLTRHRKERTGGPSRQVRRGQERGIAKLARRASSLALLNDERQAALDAVHQFRFIDRSVPYIYSTLLDEGSYLCSLSTMYRILRSVGEVGERRDQATRPAHAKPELCATGPRQVFAWDITKLHGPRKWTYFYLCAIIEIYIRCVVGWMVADRESSELARHLLEEPSARNASIRERSRSIQIAEVR